MGDGLVEEVLDPIEDRVPVPRLEVVGVDFDGEVGEDGVDLFRNVAAVVCGEEGKDDGDLLGGCKEYIALLEAKDSLCDDVGGRCDGGELTSKESQLLPHPPPSITSYSFEKKAELTQKAIIPSWLTPNPTPPRTGCTYVPAAPTTAIFRFILARWSTAILKPMLREKERRGEQV